MIKTIKFIDEYKGISHNTEIDLTNHENYTAIVGLNGSGKSSVLDAIYYIFNYNIKPNLNFYLRPELISINQQPLYGNNRNFTKKYSNLFNIKNIFYVYAGCEFNIYRWPTEGPINCLNFGYKSLNYLLLILLGANNVLKKMGLYDSTILQTYSEYDNIETLISKLELEDRLKKYTKKHKYFSQLSINDQKRFAKEILLKKKKKKKDDKYKTRKIYQLPDIGRLIINLSRGEKKMLTLISLLYIAEKEDIILMDEPDDNLDIEKKRELLKWIKKCEGQVIMTTHDPIMTNWMDGHIIAMRNGEVISQEEIDIIKELSNEELTYQDSLMLFQKRHIIVVEGKSDVTCIEKAIAELEYSDYFKDVFFLPQNSSQNSLATYENVLSKLFGNNNSNIDKILFLFDADKGGYDGKDQLVNNVISKDNSNSLNTKIDYLFYNHYDENKPFVKEAIKDYFYLEGFFKTDCYPDMNNSSNRVLKKKLFEILDNMDENSILNFNEIQRLKFFTDDLVKNNGLKNYFGKHIEKVNDDFANFKPLLNAILNKLGLPTP